MHDVVDAVERGCNGLVVADVADPQLDLGVEVGGALTRRVHLGVEIVERPHLVAARQQGVGQVRSDEAGATRDQDSHGAGCYRPYIQRAFSPS